MANARFGGQRQKKEWSSIPAVEVTMTGASTTAAAALGSTQALTVLRMIGEYVINPTSAPVALDSAFIGVGIGVVSADAFAVGGGSMPDPLTDQGYPWLYWAVHPVFFMSNSTNPGNDVMGARVTIDIRSMRKLKPQEDLAMVVEYGNGTGNPPMTFVSGGIRVLIGT